MASSFPRRRESSLVGTEIYRENGFLRFCVLDPHFRGNDGIKVSKFILNN
ncbi:pilus assembly protein PilS [Neisseria meningitidis]|nr:pilus assembly protein PilS [Neisseria meningitidis]